MAGHWLGGLVGFILLAVAGCQPAVTAAPTVGVPPAAPAPTQTRVPIAPIAPIATAPLAVMAAPTRAPATLLPLPTATPVAKTARVVAIDPGHGGAETGSVHLGPGRRADLIEKNVNLAIALALADDLRAAGYAPVLTRTTDSGVNVPPRDLNGDGTVDNDDDLQARVDIANNAGARLLLSIHNNGSPNPTVHGTSTWYSATHPLGERSRVLAGFVQAELLKGLRQAGYADARDQGANDDPSLQKPGGHLFVVGPKTARVARVSQMPGVVGESLYLTNEDEASLLKTSAIQQAIAAAYLRAVETYFARFGD